MFFFGRRKKRAAHRDTQPVHDSVVVNESGDAVGDISTMFATDDRTVIARTPDSESIAHEILELAQRVAETKQIGEKFSITLESRHPGVHYQEVAFSVMMGAHERRLDPGAVFNNVFYFTKL